jgi:hypothetical protein
MMKGCRYDTLFLLPGDILFPTDLPVGRLGYKVRQEVSADCKYFVIFVPLWEIFILPKIDTS